MTSILSRGITDPFADAVLEALVAYNATAYQRDRALPRIDEAPVVYQPDEPSASIVLVAADCLVRRLGDGGVRKVSCGTAAAAWAGWHRAAGRAAHVQRRAREHKSGMLWHAVAVVDGVAWDPARELRRLQAWAI
jgi:hypothetical protein